MKGRTWVFAAETRDEDGAGGPNVADVLKEGRVVDKVQSSLTVMRDLVAMLEVYATGRTNNETRGQALVTIREARKLMEKL
jgi:hypothetical protein